MALGLAGPAAGAQEMPEETEPPATLTMTAAPSTVNLTGLEDVEIIVVVANGGGRVASEVEIDPEWPAGIVVEGDVPAPFDLAPGEHGVHRFSLSGRLAAPDQSVIEATAEADGRTLVAVSTVAHPAAPPLATLQLAGASKLTNSSDLRVEALVTNLANVPLTVHLEGTVAEGSDRIDDPLIEPASTEIGPGRWFVVPIRVGGDRLPSGSARLIVETRVQAGEVGQLLRAAHEFETSPFDDDSLVTTIGLSSLLLVPGVAALSVWSFVRQKWRSERGLVGSWVPTLNNLGTLVLAVLLSVLALIGFARFGGEDLRDGYSTTTLGLVTIAAGAFAGIGALARWAWIRHRYPVLGPASSAADVFAALDRVLLQQGTIGDGPPGRLLWVHDGAACVVAAVRVTSSDNEVLRTAGKPDKFSDFQKAAKEANAVAEWDPIPDELQRGAITGPVPEGFQGSEPKREVVAHAL